MKTRIKVPAEIFNYIPPFIRRDVLVVKMAQQLADGYLQEYKEMAHVALSECTRNEYKNWKSISIHIDDNSPWIDMSSEDRLAVIIATDCMMMRINLEVCL